MLRSWETNSFARTLLYDVSKIARQAHFTYWQILITVVMLIRAAVWKSADFVKCKCTGYSNFSEVLIVWPSIAYKICNKWQIIGCKRREVDCTDIVSKLILKKIVQNRMQYIAILGRQQLWGVQARSIT